MRFRGTEVPSQSQQLANERGRTRLFLPDLAGAEIPQTPAGTPPRRPAWHSVGR